MAGPLAVSPQRLAEMGEAPRLKDKLGNARIVAVSGVLQVDLEAPRFQAVLRTVESSRDANVPHVIMLDDSSQVGTGDYLRRHGAIVIDIDHDTEGGLARPYVIAAQLVEEFAPYSAVMVKVEGEKPIFENADNVVCILDSSQEWDIGSGVRTPATWSSMPSFQVQTEFWLGAAIGQLLGVPSDTPSGVIALSSIGRRCFIDTVVDNDWSYLFGVPVTARKQGLLTGSFPIDFRYAPSVVAEEEGNRTFDQKRLDQIDLMLSRAYLLYDGERDETISMLLRECREMLQFRLNQVG